MLVGVGVGVGVLICLAAFVSLFWRKRQGGGLLH
jgi:hypothetical protein